VTVAILIAGIAAALFAAWGVKLQIDARRPLMTVTWEPGLAAGAPTEPQTMSYPIRIQNDGTAPIEV
jgi:hypothetical protein